LLLTVSRALDYDFFQHFSANRSNPSPETDVSIQLKVKSSNLDELLKWVSDNGNIQISRK
jgi:hypothetical protein